jgi:hypothetical protein
MVGGAGVYDGGGELQVVVVAVMKSVQGMLAEERAHE